MFRTISFLICIFISFSAIEARAEITLPQEPADEIGYFCNMTVTNHSASKAQIFLKKWRNKPLWFSTIRDVFIYINSPEEDQRIMAIYVNDMGIADWDKPEAGTWIAADKAFYVIGSTRRNGMGGASIVPFSSIDNANEFIKNYGGEIKSFNEMPKSYIFSTGEFEDTDNMGHMSP